MKTSDIVYLFTHIFKLFSLKFNLYLHLIILILISDRIRIYKLDSSLSYQYVQTLDDTVDDLGGDRNKAQRIIIEGE